MNLVAKVHEYFGLNFLMQVEYMPKEKGLVLNMGKLTFRILLQSSLVEIVI